MTAPHPAPMKLLPCPDRFLSTGEVAQMCRVSSRTVLRWYHTGVLPAVRLDNGHHRVCPEDVRKLLLQLGRPFPRILATTPLVLLSDPSPDTASQTRHALTTHVEQAVTVRALASAFELGAALVQSTPALILFDHHTPGLNAFELCRFVRTTPRLRHTGLVLYTDDIPRDERRALLESGVHTVVRKPMREADVRMVRRQWLETAWKGQSPNSA